MYKPKVIKKRTKIRQTLLRNLKKGQARKQSRCGFQLIPYPEKFVSTSKLYRLYADVILMEYNETFITDPSLLNDFKIIKHGQVFNYGGQKAIKFLVENKFPPEINWKSIIEQLQNSGSEKLKQWIKPIQDFCESYEALLKQILENQMECTPTKIQKMKETNDTTEKLRQNLIKTFPYVEYRCKLKDGQIQLTDVVYNEKYALELGYTFEDFINLILKEGLPQITPFDIQDLSPVAKARLQRFMTTEQNGYQSPEGDVYVTLKTGYVKKVRYKIHYCSFFEKGVPGFSIVVVIVAKQKPILKESTSSPGIKINSEFIDLMCQKEREGANFLSLFYDEKIEQKFINLNKICKITEIKNPEKLSEK